MEKNVGEWTEGYKLVKRKSLAVSWSMHERERNRRRQRKQRQRDRDRDTETEELEQTRRGKYYSM